MSIDNSRDSSRFPKPPSDSHPAPSPNARHGLTRARAYDAKRSRWSTSPAIGSKGVWKKTTHSKVSSILSPFKSKPFNGTKLSSHALRPTRHKTEQNKHWVTADVHAILSEPRTNNFLLASSSIHGLLRAIQRSGTAIGVRIGIISVVRSSRRPAVRMARVKEKIDVPINETCSQVCTRIINLTGQKPQLLMNGGQHYVMVDSGQRGSFGHFFYAVDMVTDKNWGVKETVVVDISVDKTTRSPDGRANTRGFNARTEAIYAQKLAPQLMSKQVFEATSQQTIEASSAQRDRTTDVKEDTRRYMPMRLMDGDAMSALAAAPREDQANVAMYLFTSGLRHLQSIHQAGYVHGDAKFENLLVGGGIDPQLSDFGSTGREGRTGRHVATYPSPERLLNNGPLNVKSDLWSFGMSLAATLYTIRYQKQWPFSVRYSDMEGSRAAIKKLDDYVNGRADPQAVRDLDHAFSVLDGGLLPLRKILLKQVLNIDPTKRAGASEVLAVLNRDVEGVDAMYQAGRKSVEISSASKDKQIMPLLHELADLLKPTYAPIG